MHVLQRAGGSLQAIDRDGGMTYRSSPIIYLLIFVTYCTIDSPSHENTAPSPSKRWISEVREDFSQPQGSEKIDVRSESFPVNISTAEDGISQSNMVVDMVWMGPCS